MRLIEILIPYNDIRIINQLKQRLEAIKSQDFDYTSSPEKFAERLLLVETKLEKRAGALSVSGLPETVGNISVHDDMKEGSLSIDD